MTSRWAGIGVLAAAAVAGLAFASVFSLVALLAPVLAVLAPMALVDQLTLGRRAAVLRAPVGLLGGAVAGAAVLAFPAPTWQAGMASVLSGLRGGWLRTLESTLPARSDAELVTFVAVLVLLAGVLGVEWLRRGAPPLVALLPGAAPLVLAQLYRAASGVGAVALACGYGVTVAVVLAAGRPGRLRGRRLVELGALALPMVLVASGGAWALAVADPVGRPAYSVADATASDVVPGSAANPLAQLGGRLSRPDEVAFTVRTDATVDRWPLVVLDGFDGAGFTSSGHYRPLGAELPSDPAVTAPTGVHTADVTPGGALGGPWLPTQFRTAAVDGTRPAVDPATGTLLLGGDDRGVPPPYRLSWRAPSPDREELVGAPVDPAAPTLQTDGVPSALADTARQVLNGAPPSFPAALTLEQWFRRTFTVATGDDLPTGSGTAQLLYFLDRSKRGTSEQFAAAYVLMARSVGIPVRLVVGFREPSDRDAQGRFVVRNREAFAWPEVAVTGLGWVALDPTGDARREPDPPGSVASAAQAARDELSQTSLFPAPQVTPPPTPPARPGPVEWSWLPVLLAVALVLAVLLVGIGAVPLGKWLRRVARRRGSARDAVVGAWREARDRLRDHGVPVRPGMTVRDLGPPAGALREDGAADARAELERLARCVDTALYAGAAVDRSVADEAWAATGGVRRALAARPWRARIRAALRPGTLVGRKRPR